MLKLYQEWWSGADLAEVAAPTPIVSYSETRRTRLITQHPSVFIDNILPFLAMQRRRKAICAPCQAYCALGKMILMRVRGQKLQALSERASCHNNLQSADTSYLYFAT
jgi:hypothetical protein